MKVLYLSPSTQERNLYTDKSTEEFNMNRLADDLVKKLSLAKLTIYRNDPKKDHIAAIRDSNHKRPNLHLALHTNAGGGSGVEVFYDPRKPKSKLFAQRLADSVARALGIPNRGIKDGVAAGLAEVRGARKDVEAVLIELFFHDNAKDVEAYRKHYASVVNELAWQIKVYFA